MTVTHSPKWLSAINRLTIRGAHCFDCNSIHFIWMCVCVRLWRLLILSLRLTSFVVDFYFTCPAASSVKLYFRLHLSNRRVIHTGRPVIGLLFMYFSPIFCLKSGNKNDCCSLHTDSFSTIQFSIQMIIALDISMARIEIIVAIKRKKSILYNVRLSIIIFCYSKHALWN